MPYTDHTSPNTEKKYDSIAPQYDAHFDNSFDRSEEDFIFEQYSHGLQRANVLDLGCGTGLVLKKASRMLFKPRNYIGVDYSSNMIAEARRQFPKADFVCMDMVQYMNSLPEAHFDVVVSSYFPMNYCEHEASVVYAAVARILKRGGTFINVMASSRYAARGSHIVEAHHMRRYFDNTPQYIQAIPDSLDVVCITGVNYFIEKYRKVLELCPAKINQHLFKIDQQRGEKSGRKPLIYVIYLEKT